jgi:hypothetical protein
LLGEVAIEFSFDDSAARIGSGHQHRKVVRLLPSSSPSSSTMPGAAPFVQPDDLFSAHCVEEVDVFDTGFEKSQGEDKVARPTTRLGAGDGTAVGGRFV